MHLRSPSEPHSPRYLTLLFLAQMAAELLTLALAIAVLRFLIGATPRNLGWQPRKLVADAKLSLAALLAATPPLLVLQVGLLYALKSITSTFRPTRFRCSFWHWCSGCSTNARTASPPLLSCTWRLNHRRRSYWSAPINMFSFHLHHTDTTTAARRRPSSLRTARWRCRPSCPWARGQRQGTGDRAACRHGAQMVLANTYHLR